MKNRTKAIVFCLSFLAGCAIIPAAQAGGVNLGMLEGEVKKILDRLGITTGGVYTASSGWTDTAASNLDMAGYEITGNPTNVIAITAGVGAPTLLTAAQSGSLVTNYGTTVKAACTLPASPAEGTFFDFLCVDNDGLRIVGNASQALYLGELGTTVGAGYAETVRLESGLRLTYRAGTETWRGSQIEGTWRKDSTTSAGFAFTPTAWTAFSPVASTAGDADVTVTGTFRHVGDSLEQTVDLNFTGAPPTETLSIDPVPTGYTADTTKIAGGSYIPYVGSCICYDSAPSGATTAGFGYLSSGQIYFRSTTAANATNWSESAPVAWANGDALSWRGTIPVQ